MEPTADRRPEPAPEPQPGTVAYACAQFITMREGIAQRVPMNVMDARRAGDIGQPPPPATAAPAAPPPLQPPPSQWSDLGSIYAARLARQGTGIQGCAKR
jgi:hypothetical protein